MDTADQAEASGGNPVPSGMELLHSDTNPANRSVTNGSFQSIHFSKPVLRMVIGHPPTGLPVSAETRRGPEQRFIRHSAPAFSAYRGL